MTLWREEEPFECKCVQRITKRAPNGKVLETEKDAKWCPLHRGDAMDPNYPPTVRMTHHARERCEEMGVTTQRVKHALRMENRAISRPSKGCTLVVSDLEPTLAFVVSPDDPYLVVTVLERTYERYERKGKEKG